ncbi:unnamed protein product [Protopolystoma xenopodis]|uniref:Uncharacterized protein n=1 Tax=Protopolystoma xenopodis TaxID=117903 RepID=A0A3S5BT60_9PLAT|nr:unnamed protein product [Protopolystoma xenopodis]
MKFIQLYHSLFRLPYNLHIWISITRVLTSICLLSAQLYLNWGPGERVLRAIFLAAGVISISSSLISPGLVLSHRLRRPPDEESSTSYKPDTKTCPFICHSNEGYYLASAAKISWGLCSLFLAFVISILTAVLSILLHVNCKKSQSAHSNEAPRPPCTLNSNALCIVGALSIFLSLLNLTDCLTYVFTLCKRRLDVLVAQNWPLTPICAHRSISQP